MQSRCAQAGRGDAGIFGIVLIGHLSSSIGIGWKDEVIGISHTERLRYLTLIAFYKYIFICERECCGRLQNVGFCSFI